ncbi:hypothetical protein GVAMD_0340 [Gardnerella vaginalis AMD]|nr:hypothetical protein GVAMD_0340 [Gardnerella vaginalis AMD]
MGRLLHCAGGRADAAARCPPCEQVLPVLGVILLFPLSLLCRVRALPVCADA